MKHYSVLIVEKLRVVRDSLHGVFLTAGYRCLLAGDGLEALEVFRRERPELVVTSVKIPILTGIELLQQVRQEDADTAVIVLSSVTDAATIADALKFGASDVLMKPINVNELLIAAERALERRQARRSLRADQVIE